MTLTSLLGSLFMPQKERRKNRVEELEVPSSNAHLIYALATISNMTRAKMSDAEFRLRAQDLAHEALVKERK